MQFRRENESHKQVQRPTRAPRPGPGMDGQACKQVKTCGEVYRIPGPTYALRDRDRGHSDRSRPAKPAVGADRRRRPRRRYLRCVREKGEMTLMWSGEKVRAVMIWPGQQVGWGF